MNSTRPYVLYNVKGWGGAIVELVLERSGLPYEPRYMDSIDLKGAAFLKLNPLGQVPALALPTGEVLTESLAITTLLCERAQLPLVPAADSPHRAAYLRWSTFLVASLYPTFTYGDEPSRWTGPGPAADALRAATDAFREAMWRQVEAAAAPDGPWFLGAQESLVDTYLAVMTLWRPRWEWFEANTPRLAAVARRYRESPAFKTVYARNG